MPPGETTLAKREAVPAAIVPIYLRLRERGVTRRDACRICGVAERTVRDREKADPKFAKAEQAAAKGRAIVHRLICEKAVEAIDDPHGRNAVHWANWLLRVYGSPLPQVGIETILDADAAGRVVINLVAVQKSLEDERPRRIAGRTRRALPRDESKQIPLVSDEPESGAETLPVGPDDATCPADCPESLRKGVSRAHPVGEAGRYP